MVIYPVTLPLIVISYARECQVPIDPVNERKRQRSSKSVAPVLIGAATSHALATSMNSVI
jgi:hypothetical protein